jgi:3-oxoacyl-[acyl-carrier protein] reductase
MDNKDKRILVTGASKGIGRGIAIGLVKEGYDVTCHYHSDFDGVQHTLENMGDVSNGKIVKFDVSKTQECAQILEQYVEEHGAFWGVVVNAGIKKDGSFLSMEEGDWNDVISTNLGGFYNVLKPLVRSMLQLRKGGRIVCISSLSGSVGVGGQVNYSASKGGIEAAARSLAMELAKRKVTVNCVCPGFIETEMLSDIDMQSLQQQVPMKKIGSVEEVSALVNFLMSEQAGYITKQSIRIDGGIG